MSSIDQPWISIVILIGSQRQRAEKTLASVLNQEGLDRAEILLFDTAYAKYPPIHGSEHPRVKVIDSMSATSYRALRAQAAEMASGEVVAYLEDYAEALPNWLKVIMRGFQDGHAGVGGIPQASNPGVGFSAITGIVNYKYITPAASPARAYVVATLPNHNSAYRRDILLSFGDLLPTLIASDYLLGTKITEKGHTLLIDPECRFLHANLENTLAIKTNFFYWNIIFGRVRAEVFHWSWQRRILQALVVPVSPFVRYFKYLFHLYKHDRKQLPPFFHYTGVTLYIQLVAAIGIAIGSLFDLEDAEIKFLKYELDLEYSESKSSQGPRVK